MKIKPIIISVVIAQMAGAIGAIFTSQNIPTWYAMLAKPSWNPPNEIFAPVWITLYTFIGIAAALVWLKRDRVPEARRILAVYAVHLFLNTLWSILFFGAHTLGLAFVEILLLLGMIIYLTVVFWRIDWRAGALLIPYALWVSFASFLNFTIWQLN